MIMISLKLTSAPYIKVCIDKFGHVLNKTIFTFE